MMSNHEPKWMCWRCGYAMDSSSSTTGEHAVPEEGDLSVCLNCGAIYTRHGAAWVPITSIELATIDQATRNTIDRIEVARRAAIRTDLIDRKGHA